METLNCKNCGTPLKVATATMRDGEFVTCHSCDSVTAMNLLSKELEQKVDALLEHELRKKDERILQLRQRAIKQEIEFYHTMDGLKVE